ncbi:hypothetical protein [Clostridium sp.]|jgi:hypothetical protein|uniref:hypothetical protein n=1 Tax=Clostridium sp. TaxID=1506 RepID=UPI002FDD00DE
MTEKNDSQEQLSVDEQAKQQFLEELKNKNMEEKKKLEEFKNQQEKSQGEDELESTDENNVLNDKESKEVDYESSSEPEHIVLNENIEPEKEDTDEHDVVDMEKDKAEDTLQPKIDKSQITNIENKVNAGGDKAIKEDKKAFYSKFNVALLPKSLKVSIIDTVVTSVVSLAALYLFDVILRLVGYQVVDMKGMYILIFIIVLILYPFIMSKFKYKQTIGQKFS